MEKLLQCFEYIKRYHVDMLDSISIMLELFIIKNFHPDILSESIALGSKRKPLAQSLNAKIEELIGQELFIAINPNINFLKILKLIQATDTTLGNIEEFLHIITQKKTSNKLYYYSTPLEINELLVRLLDIQSDEKIYNPCYGIGTLFLMISQILRARQPDSPIALYGEELDMRLAKVAKLTCKLANIACDHLIINDILKAPFFEQKFDKIICNPPFSAHIGVEYLKDDKRFKGLHSLAKTYAEWVFLIHALYYLKKRAVFILRTQTLQKSSLESEFMQRFYKQGLIEAIIELPKNIFPHQNADFCVLVLSPDNEEILNIDAKGERFWKKDGKYNRLVNLNEILEAFFTRKENDFCFLMPYTHLTSYHLPLTRKDTQHKEGKSLSALGVEIFRGQRVYGGKSDTRIDYYDVGLADFSEYGFSEEFFTKRSLGDSFKVQKYALKPYDICLSLRGNTPKVTIFSPNIAHKLAVANAGIVIVRCASPKQAIGLYCYFYSHQGQKALSTLYEHYTKSIDIQNLKSLIIPTDFESHSQERFEQICAFSNQLKEVKDALEALRG